MPGLMDIDRGRNLRDVGGIATGDGRIIRPGRIFRCGSPHLLSEHELSFVATSLRVRSLIDLRGSHEVDEFPAPVERLSAEYFSVPFPPQQSNRGDGPLPALLDAYLAIAQLSGASVVELVRILSAPNRTPALIFCAAGKDRTGVAIALLLGMLDVDEELIVEDYARSGVVDPRALGEIYAQRTANAPPDFHASEPATMRAFLSEMRREHGSVRRFVANCGVGAAELRALERALLVDD